MPVRYLSGLIVALQSGLCVDAGSSLPLPLLASIFQNHMVLQRGGAGAVVWGFASAAEKVCGVVKLCGVASAHVFERMYMCM